MASCAQLLTYARYVKDMNIQEEFLFSSPLPTHTTGEHTFNKLKEYVRKNDIDWERCCGICSDGAKSMTGRHSGLVSRVKELTQRAVWTHCTIHRQALAAKKMPNDLRSVLDEAVKIVNLIKARPLNARLFHILCDDLGAHYKQLLLHTEVRWLSRGRVLSQRFDLREEELLFLSNGQSPLAQHMSNLNWIARLAYVSDIFICLNTLNTSLKGRDDNAFLTYEQVSSFRRKLDLWDTRVEKGCLDMFPTLADFMKEIGLLVVTIQPLVAEHLRGLCQQFTHYFSDETIQDKWIRDPFEFKPAESDALSIQDEEALIDLTSNHELEQMITHSSIGHFWLSVQNEFPELTQRALRKLLPFVSTYLCESGFSAMTFIKNKYRSRLQVEDDLCLFLTSLQPQISLLCAASCVKREAHYLRVLAIRKQIYNLLLEGAEGHNNQSCPAGGDRQAVKKQRLTFIMRVSKKTQYKL